MGGKHRRRSRGGGAILLLCVGMLLSGLQGPQGALGDPGLRTAPRFGPFSAYPVPVVEGPWSNRPPDPSSTAVADVTGDGLNDVIVSNGGLLLGTHPNPNEYKLVVFPGQADGSLGAPTKLPTHGSGTGDPMAIDAGDITNDGLADVAMGTNVGIDIYVQAPAGGLLPPVLLPSSTPVTQVEVGKLEGNDPYGDLLAVSGEGVTYYKYQQGLVFQPITVTPQVPDEIEMADAAGGDDLDVVTALGNTIRVYRAHTEFIQVKTYETYFDEPHEYIAEGAEPLAGGLAVGDVSGDGLNDVALSIASTGGDGRMFVFVQKEEFEDGEPSLLPGVSYPTRAESPRATEASDLDGDGRAELVTLHLTMLGLYRSEPDGTLGEECLFPIAPTNGEHKALAIGDLNNDGRPDLAVAGNEDGAIVLLQSTSEPTSTSISLSPPPPAKVDDPVTISGVLDLQGGCPTMGQQVTVTRTSPDGSQAVLSAVTGASGAFSVQDVPTTSGPYDYQAAWEGDVNHASATSPPVSVVPERLGSSIKLEVAVRPFFDDPADLSGSLHLPHGDSPMDQTIWISTTAPDGSVSETTAVTDAAGRFSLSSIPLYERTLFQARWEGNARHVDSMSEPLSVLPRRLGSSVTLVASSPIPEAGGSLLLSGALHLSNGDSPAGKTLRLATTAPDGSVTDTLVVTDADGRFSLSLPVEQRALFQAHWAGNARQLDSMSEPLFVFVRAALDGRLAGFSRSENGVKVFRAGKPVRYTATISPAHEELDLVVQERDGGKWRKVETSSLDVGKGGKAPTLLPRAAGKTFRVRVTFGGDDDHLPARTAWARYRIAR